MQERNRRNKTTMDKEWIANLAKDIRQKGREAAERFGREQHKAGVIATQGRSFFMDVVLCLEDNINDVKRQLQGDVTASETVVSRSALQLSATRERNGERDQVTLTRNRFPWFDAQLTLQDSTIVLDYAKGLGIAGDRSLDRKTCHFAFHVADDDVLSVQEAFGDRPHTFQTPEDLARHITELLFQM